MTTQLKARKLRQILGRMPSAVVCLSGGVDSALLLAMAAEVLGDRVTAFTADSPALPREELAQTAALVRQLGVRHVVRATHELENADYAANPSDRCYFCKTELLRTAAAVAAELGCQEVLIGTTADDLGGHRPGLRAAGEQGARHPLVEADLKKTEVRELAQQLELPVWDKPEMACLASRLPYGTPVTRERLGRIERFEQALGALGLTGLRVRLHDPVARLELPPEQIARAASSELREEIVRIGRACGFVYVTLDLAGYRRGAMNELLPAPERGPDAAQVTRALKGGTTQH
ncbi:MAG: ATP-dependent sacrificial sulfur transferase LarE [Proteobacteria bacterium]|nr:ATP-dependent sacrificial sulfur transferase LarE [Pseudomonadota bacterium]